MFRIPVFKCDWVDNRNGIKADDLGFTLVDFNKTAHKSNPFILASQAKQVFYVQDQHVQDGALPQVEALMQWMTQMQYVCEIPQNRMDAEEEEKPTKKKHRGMTRKSMLIKNRSKGIKLSIKYNLDGIFIGESVVHLTSYLGVLARTMVPITYKTWHVVPKELKDKLWDCIEEELYANNWKVFRSFKSMLTVKYILPFKDQPELLKRPPIKYTFIRDEEWTMFVKDRLSENFKMVASGLTETIDRSILWKKAREKKDGTFDEVAIPVIEKIDKLLKESEENGRSVNGSNDILVEALGTPEYSGRVRAKGKHHTPRQYFNTATDRAVRDFIATSQEEQRRFQAEVLAKLSQVGVVTPHSDVSSSNMKQKQLFLPEVVEKPIRRVEDATPPMPIEPQSKVRKCELAMGTKENKVGGGTIILECGPNYLVVVDVPYDASAPLPIPIPGQTTTVGAAIGYQVLWPAHLVSIHTPVLASKKGKKEIVNEVEVKSKSEKPQDVKNFEALYWFRKLEWERKQGKQVLVALEMKRMIAYYLDPMASQPCDDLKEIVNMAIRINPPEKQKTSKREPTWVKVVCPRQPGSVECGYYVMRYMKEIIANPNQLTAKFDGRKSFSEMEINEVRSDWIMLMTQLIITHA
ncbi:hypothetical protein CK203_109088 [Vitis vinifera]|uniref:DUF4216 domain-containing protein n=1 Tax=Vitis vinifera TaxID=29760 RepID=A0A438CCJ0_VITVI|nr:hypothetical protein CK203_109088 [Vitis vinifera]